MTEKKDETASAVNALLADHVFKSNQNSALTRELEKQREELLRQQVAIEQERQALMEAQIRERERYERLRETTSQELHFKRSEIDQATQELEKRREEQIAWESKLRQAQQEGERELREKVAAFESQKRRYDIENNKKLQTNSSKFVGDVVKELRAKEKSLSKMSVGWSVLGATASAFALGIIGYALYQTLTFNQDPTWRAIAFSAGKGAIFIGVLGVLSRYSFLLSKRYFDESLRFSRIVHNISFGQLYVESYGATAGWDQVKEAFSNWSSIESEKTMRQEAEGHTVEQATKMPKVDLSTFSQVADVLSKFKT